MKLWNTYLTCKWHVRKLAGKHNGPWTASIFFHVNTLDLNTSCEYPLPEHLIFISQWTCADGITVLCMNRDKESFWKGMEDEAARPEQKFNVIKSGGKRGAVPPETQSPSTMHKIHPPHFSHTLWIPEKYNYIIMLSLWNSRMILCKKEFSRRNVIQVFRVKYFCSTLQN